MPVGGFSRLDPIIDSLCHSRRRFAARSDVGRPENSKGLPEIDTALTDQQRGEEADCESPLAS